MDFGRGPSTAVFSIVSGARPWRIADVLDFESLLSRESESPQQARERDRALWVSQIAPHLPPGLRSDRSVVFRRWLELRRDALGAESPGSYFNTGWQSLLLLAAVIGLCLGGGVTTGVLHYPENEPVNAIQFLEWTLLPQWLFLVGALAFLVFRRGLGLSDNFAPVRALIRLLIDGLGALLRRLPGDKRASVSRTFATVRERRERYGGLATWPLVIVTQLFAVCFNLAILGTFLTEVTVRELRFGWQTTLDVQPRRVGQLVRAFAAPWSWAPEAHPTAAQVAATRYAPGQRHETLPAEAMRAWWPFLAYAIAIYGLGVRGALLLFAAIRLRSNLQALQFNYPEANALWHRLQGPVFASEPNSAQPRTEPEILNSLGEAHPAGGTCWVFLAEDLQLSEADLTLFLSKTYGWEVGRVVRVKIDNRRNSGAELECLRAAVPHPAVVVVVAPVSRDPIVAIALFLKDLLGAAGKECEALLLLAGNQGDVSRLKFWRDFRAEHQLRMNIETWHSP